MTLAIVLVATGLFFVIAALIFGAWTTTVRRRDAQLVARVNSLQAGVADLRSKLALTDRTSLKAEIDDLRGALDLMRTSMRRELGSVHKRMGLQEARGGRVFDGATGERLPPDEELAAVLALQSAPPAKPQ